MVSIRNRKYLSPCNVRKLPVKKSYLTFRTLSTLVDHADDWNRILPEKHHLRAEQLLPLELSALSDLTFLYLICYSHDEPVAIAYFQYVHFKTRHYPFPLSRNIFTRSIEKFIMRNGYRILVCGNLFRVDFPGIFMQEGKVSASVVFEAIEQFFNEVRPKPHVLLLKDWKEMSTPEQVGSYGYKPWPGDLTMKLDLRPEWVTFHDYSLALKHKYAQRLRKIQASGSSICRKELQLEDIVRHGPELETLYCNVVKKQVIRLVIANWQYFMEMKKARGNDFRVIGYYEHEKLIGLSSHIIYDELWELHYIGMDYSKNEKYALYFNMMFDGIRMAIEEKKKAVELGRTAREAKAMIGAQPIYFQSYFRLKGWLVNFLVDRFASVFNEKAGSSWQYRQPFRKGFRN